MRRKGQQEKKSSRVTYVELGIGQLKRKRGCDTIFSGRNVARVNLKPRIDGGIYKDRIDIVPKASGKTYIFVSADIVTSNPFSE